MRMMLRWTVPAQKGNAMIQDGTIGGVIESVLKKTQAEAAYFMALDGKRAGMVFFDMKEPADIPHIAELLFLGAEAEVEFIPVMNGDDLRKALSSL